MNFLKKIIKTVHQSPVLILLCLSFVLLLSRYGLNGGEIVTFAVENTSGIDSVDQAVYEGERNTPPSLKFANKTNGRSNTNRWTYRCLKDTCVRKQTLDFEFGVSFEECWLTCGKHGSVWPYPKIQQRSLRTVEIFPENIQLVDVKAETETVEKLIKDAFKLKQNFFRNRLKSVRKKNKNYSWPFSNIFGDDKNLSEVNVVEVFIKTNETDEVLTLDTDESYEISIVGTGYFAAGKKERVRLAVTISASTFFGVRHGIETFSQLVAFDDVRNCLLILRDYYAYDKPYYPYRGVLVDTARNFIPLKILKSVIDGMALNKLNVLHMHLTDSNSFPFYSNRVPQMTEYGAISPNHIYYPEDLQSIVQYAKIRGIKVIPELDAPSHAGNGWQWGPSGGLGHLAFYINFYENSWPHICGQPPCGILNPINVNTYDVLENLYADMFDIFDKDLFHMGGDEVKLSSWTRRQELKDALKGIDPLDLWKLFQTEAFKRLKLHSPNVTAILWTSKLTGSNDIVKTLQPEDYIIQIWDSTAAGTRKLVSQGYSVIVSFANELYLDWGGGSWLGKEHMWNYIPWQSQYDVNRRFPQQKSGQVLGAEATLWSEKVGPYDIETRLFPRVCALGESLWSNPKDRTGDVFTRINFHNNRMRLYGIRTNQLQPESCMYFKGHCEKPSDII